MAVVVPSRGALEFAGYMTERGELKFTLTDTETKKNTPWLVVGAKVDGYTVVGFDAKTETLTLTKADAIMRLPLKGARMVTVPAVAPKSAEPEPLTAAQHQLKIQEENLAKKKAVEAAIEAQRARKTAVDAERARKAAEKETTAKP